MKCETTIKAILGGSSYDKCKISKDRLKNKSVISGKTFQDALITYGLEEQYTAFDIGVCWSIYSKRRHIFVCAFWRRIFKSYKRRWSFSNESLPNTIEDIRQYSKNIFYRLWWFFAIWFMHIGSENIAEFKEYHGVNVSVIAYLDKQVPISIDIGWRCCLSKQGKVSCITQY